MRFLAATMIALFAVSGCGSDENSPSSDAQIPDANASSGEAESGGEGASVGSAVVVVDGNTHEMNENTGCRLAGDGTVFASFADGDDMVSLTSAEGTVLVRLTIDGTEWVDPGSASPPEVEDGTATWSGEMVEFNGGGSAGTVTITMTC